MTITNAPRRIYSRGGRLWEWVGVSTTRNDKKSKESKKESGRDGFEGLAPRRPVGEYISLPIYIYNKSREDIISKAKKKRRR